MSPRSQVRQCTSCAGPAAPVTRSCFHDPPRVHLPQAMRRGGWRRSFFEKMLASWGSFPFPTLNIGEGRELPLLYWSWWQGFQRHTWKAWWVFLNLGINLSHSYGTKAKRLSWSHLWRWEGKMGCVGQVVMLGHTMTQEDSGDWSWMHLEGALLRRATAWGNPISIRSREHTGSVLRVGVVTTDQLGTATAM